MDIGKALKLLAECLNEIEYLKMLSYNREDGKLWMNRVEVILKAAFGKDSEEYKELESPYIKVISFDEEDRQKDYVSDLNLYGQAIKKILQKYEILGVPVAPRTTAKGSLIPTPQPKAFIAHGGDSPALSKLKSFLKALGVEPLVVEEQPSEGRSVAENVDWYSRQADCAIILATKGDVDARTGGFIPRGNVLMETGKLQEIFKDRIVYLLQAGTKFPTSISEKVRERFTSQNMDNAFIKIAKELKKFGILRAVKP